MHMKSKKLRVYVLTDVTPENELVVLAVHRTRSGAARDIKRRVAAEPDILCPDTFSIGEFEVLA